MSAARQSRIRKELQMLQQEPVPGCSVSPCGADPLAGDFRVQIVAGADSPYAGGAFKLSLQLPSNYPFEPPALSFVTRVYHPNIDSAGRICMDSLKPRPAGSWSPAMNVRGLLLQLLLLLSSPNPDDPLEADVARQFVSDRPAFERTAREWTLRYASIGQRLGQSAEGAGRKRTSAEASDAAAIDAEDDDAENLVPAKVPR